MRNAHNFDRDERDLDTDVVVGASFSESARLQEGRVHNSGTGNGVAGCKLWLLLAAVAIASFVAGAKVGDRSGSTPAGVVSILPPSSPSTARDSSRAEVLRQTTVQPCPSAVASVVPVECPPPTPCDAASSLMPLEACPSIAACPSAVESSSSAAPSPAGATSPCPAVASAGGPATGSKRADDAVCEADDLREVGSLKWGSQHWCPEMDTGGSWAPLNETNVPLVPYGIDTRSDPNVAARIYYGPDGLIHENNAPGGLNVVRQQEPELVSHRCRSLSWAPGRCPFRLSAGSAVTCSAGRLQHALLPALPLVSQGRLFSACTTGTPSHASSSSPYDIVLPFYFDAAQVGVEASRLQPAQPDPSAGAADAARALDPPRCVSSGGPARHSRPHELRFCTQNGSASGPGRWPGERTSVLSDSLLPDLLLTYLCSVLSSC